MLALVNYNLHFELMPGRSGVQIKDAVIGFGTGQFVPRNQTSAFRISHFASCDTALHSQSTSDRTMDLSPSDVKSMSGLSSVNASARGPTGSRQITRNRASYSCHACRRRKVKCDKVWFLPLVSISYR